MNVYSISLLKESERREIQKIKKPKERVGENAEKQDRK
jgi:hypothetical protein